LPGKQGAFGGEQHSGICGVGHAWAPSLEPDSQLNLTYE
jgi:hypothetical protein